MVDKKCSPATATLLPCPFCGEENIYLNEPSEFSRYGSINCPACMVDMPGAIGGDGQAELIACWNTRASLQPVPYGAARALRPEALQALKGYIQADADGVMVYVSRQALDEAIAALDVAQPTRDQIYDIVLRELETRHPIPTTVLLATRIANALAAQPPAAPKSLSLSNGDRQ